MALISMKQTLVVLVVSMEIRGSVAALRFSSGLQRKDKEERGPLDQVLNLMKIFSMVL